MSRHAKGMDAATAAALSSSGVGGKRAGYRVGAAIYSGRTLLTAKANSLKTHPKCLRFSKYPYLHAEVAAILDVGLQNCDGATLYVSRIRRDGSRAMAKPCPDCQKWIELANFRNVFYTDNEGQIATF